MEKLKIAYYRKEQGKNIKIFESDDWGNFINVYDTFKNNNIEIVKDGE